MRLNPPPRPRSLLAGLLAGAVVFAGSAFLLAPPGPARTDPAQANPAQADPAQADPAAGWPPRVAHVPDPPRLPVACGVRITVAASPEKYPAMADIAARFHRTSAGEHCGQVRVVKASSGDMFEALTTGTAGDIQVWSPAASGWTSLLRHRITRGQVADPDLEVVNVDRDGNLPAVTRTPLVLAMPKPIAERIGAVSWESVVGWAGDPQRWRLATGGAFGDFKLGKTDPTRSTSGLSSLLATYTAAAGHPVGATDLTDRRVRAKVSDVERAAMHYGDTTLTYLCHLAAVDAGAGGDAELAEQRVAAYVSAVPVEEQSVYLYNMGRQSDCESTHPQVPLVPVYPTDGTVWSDSPYAILNTATPAQHRLAGNFLRYLHDQDLAPGDEHPQTTFQADGFRDEARLELYPVAAAGAGGLRPRPELTAIGVPEPDVLDRVRESWQEVRKPARIIFLIDVSGSMLARAAPGRTRIAEVRRALREVVPTIAGRTEIGLWSFSGSKKDASLPRHSVVVAPTLDRARILDALDSLRPERRFDTALYDAVRAAHDQLGPGSAGHISAVVVLSDGKDDICPAGATCDPAKELRDLVTAVTFDDARPVRVFTVAYADAAAAELGRVALAAGGNAYDAGRDADGLERAIGDVISNF
ncbi:substrate-binding domain-containing protein [Actinoplanes sp. NPDC051494]|uniref:vWA domain-containing protein n=1 Tax=Actinoplanes sp. NPDC051494 TaxID=3363907 RepID=UPI003790E22B